MKAYTFFLVWFISLTSSFGQITFQKIINGSNESQANAVRLTNDSGYIFAGYIRPTVSDYMDVYLVKTNSTGNVIWTKTIGGDQDDEANAVEQTKDGGYIITGTTTDTAGNDALFLVKTDASGDTLWTRSYNGITYSVGNFVQQTFDGGYIVAGWTNSFGNGQNNVYLVKTNANGDTAWTKAYGSSGNEIGSCVRQTADSGYIVVGYTFGSGAGNADVLLIRTNAGGDAVWTKTYGGAINDIGFSVEATADGGYIIAGSTNSFGAGDDDVYLIKTDQIGDTLWTRAYGGASDDDASEVLQTNDGYIIAGTTTSFSDTLDDVYIIKTNLNGDALWSRTFGGTDNDDGYSIAKATDGGYIIGGYSASFVSSGVAKSAYIIKTDSNGNAACNEGFAATQVHSTGTQTAVAITLTTFGASTSPNDVVVGSAGSDSALCFTVGINEAVDNNTLLIYPNPVRNELRIIPIKSEEELKIENIGIYNVLGVKVYDSEPETKNYKQETVLDVSFLPPAIYFVQMTAGKERWIGRFVKE